MNMNTNSNTYTIIYTTVIVTLVAAVLAFVSQSLKSRQEANEKADTISQMMTAAQFATKADLQKMGNTAVLAKYADEIAQAFTVGADGKKSILPRISRSRTTTSRVEAMLKYPCSSSRTE